MPGAPGCSAVRWPKVELGGATSGRLKQVADPIGIAGIGTVQASRLEAAGIHIMPGLAHFNAANLHARLTEAQGEKSLRFPPSGGKVARWGKQATALPRDLPS